MSSLDFLVFNYKGASLSLREFLAEKLSISRKAVKKIIDRGWVFVNEERARKASYLLKAGDKIEVLIYEFEPRHEILYEDEYLLVAYKPPFTLSNASPYSLEAFLRKGGFRVRAIHRLDFETSGVLLFAKSNSVFERFKGLFREREIGKLYKVIAEGLVERDSFEVSSPVEGKEARSFFRVLRRGVIATLLDVRILTGRKHQIRLHLSKIGHPVVGDKLYRKGRVEHRSLRMIPRCMLHCEEISFRHPFKGELLRIRAPLPEDFKTALRELSLLEDHILYL